MEIIDEIKENYMGLFIILLILLCSGILQETFVRIPKVEIDNGPYTIKRRKPNRSEKHLEGFSEDEKAMIKLISSIIVKHVIRNA